MIKNIIIPRYEDCDLSNLPKEAVVITNSERSGLLCPRKYWYESCEGLKPITESKYFRWGIGWHAMQEAIHRHFMEFDSPFDDSVWLDELKKIEEGWQLKVDLNRLSSDDMEMDLERLRRGMEAYITRNGRAPYEDYKVVAVEQALYAPIYDPNTEGVFMGDTAIVDEPWGHRRARTLDSSDDIRVESRPYYYLGKADVILMDREPTKRGTHMVWVLDHKYTGSPQKYNNVGVTDLQMPGYCWMLDSMIRNSFADFLPNNSKVAGFIFHAMDSSVHRDPTVLKSGKLSTASNAKVYSWNFIKYCNENEIDISDYSEYIESLKIRNDSGVFVSDTNRVQVEDLVRFGMEAYGVARRVSELRLNSAIRPNRDINYTHPRLPLCKAPGSSCVFSSICFYDAPYSLSYEVGDDIKWITQQDSQDNSEILREELGW
jgi:hypothetical protein